MKLDVKEWINKITTMFTVSQKQTFTACGKNWEFRKIGNIVFLDAPADIKTASSGLNTIGTLPVGMRPAYVQRICAGNNASVGKFLNIATDGVVSFYTNTAISSAQNNSFSTSFIVGGVVRKLLKALKSLTLKRGWAK